jgi:hypothetical protein
MREARQWDRRPHPGGDPALSGLDLEDQTVMGQLRERQHLLRKKADGKAAGELLAAGVLEARRAREATAAKVKQEYQDQARADRTGFSVLAFLFAQPDSAAIQTLEARREYFDVRTGNTWDLFFPGYYRSLKDPDCEPARDARPVGRGFAGDWFFHPREFNALREHVERESKRRWEYSGETDLVLINCFLADEGDPTIDWTSTISGTMSDVAGKDGAWTLSRVIEKITNDQLQGNEDPKFGVGGLIDGPPPAGNTAVREFFATALGEIAASLAARGTGL